mgnify:CR=1 FL=1
MIKELGELLGNIIVFLYVLTILNYILKFINKKYLHLLKKNDKLHSIYMKFMKFIIRNHKLFGILTVFFILLHFYIQFTTRGLSITGLIAATIMLLQVLLGIYGSKTKRKNKTWLVLHRFISILLLIAILIHIN